MTSDIAYISYISIYIESVHGKHRTAEYVGRGSIFGNDCLEALKMIDLLGSCDHNFGAIGELEPT